MLLFKAPAYQLNEAYIKTFHLSRQRIERGEIIDTGEYRDFFETSEDGKDVISSLPKHVALLV